MSGGSRHSQTGTTNPREEPPWQTWGKNRTVDDISADHLDRIGKELAAIGKTLPEQVMIRIADAMHDACTDTWLAAEAARDVVPDRHNINSLREDSTMTAEYAALSTINIDVIHAQQPEEIIIEGHRIAINWHGQYRVAADANSWHVRHGICAHLLDVPGSPAPHGVTCMGAEQVSEHWSELPCRIDGIDDIGAALAMLVETGRAHQAWRAERDTAELAVRAELNAAVEALRRVGDVPAGAQRWMAQQRADSELDAVAVKAMRHGLVSRAELATLPGMHESRLVNLEIASQDAGEPRG